MTWGEIPLELPPTFPAHGGKIAVGAPIKLMGIFKADLVGLLHP